MPSNADFASHMHLVLAIVAEFMRRVPRSVQREDLVAAGSMGLLQALRSNRHTCPEMLVAYARIRIRGAIIDELRRHDWSPRRRRGAVTRMTTPVDASTDVVIRSAEQAEDASAPPTKEKPTVVVIGLDDLPHHQALSEEGPSPLEMLEARCLSRDVRSAIARLAPRERTIVTMRYFEDVPSKTIASKMGLSEARVSQLLARATSQLRELLTEREAELDVAA
jgi:RNA polymerase sigma factor for flagellar operon FliA